MKTLLYTLITLLTVNVFGQLNIPTDTTWIDLEPNIRNEVKLKAYNNGLSDLDVEYRIISENALSQTDWKVEFCDCDECKVGLTPSGSCTISGSGFFYFALYVSPKNNIQRAYVKYRVFAKNDTAVADTFVFATRAATSINNITETNNSLVLFPNPSRGVFSLSLDSKTTDVFSLTIVNILGEQVLSSTIYTDGRLEKEIDLSNVKKGVYFLSLSNGSQAFYKRLTIK